MTLVGDQARIRDAQSGPSGWEGQAVSEAFRQAGGLREQRREVLGGDDLCERLEQGLNVRDDSEGVLPLHLE
jgi:hypothetical protein